MEVDGVGGRASDFLPFAALLLGPLDKALPPDIVILLLNIGVEEEDPPAPVPLPPLLPLELITGSSSIQIPLWTSFDSIVDKEDE